MALPTKLTLEIVTPDRAVLREEVDEVVVPGSEGYLGVLPGHTPLLSALKVGERAQEIDIQRAERAKQRAEALLASPTSSVDFDIERARVALMKSLIRLQVATRARTRV